MKVRDLLVLSGSEARLAAFDRHAELHRSLRESRTILSAGDWAGLHAVTGTMNFVQYLIGGVIEGTFCAGKGSEKVGYSATVWGPGVGCGVVKGAGAFVWPPGKLLGPATVYVASDAETLEITWFDEDDKYLGFFIGASEGISVGAQVAAGTFTRPAMAAM